MEKIAKRFTANDEMNCEKTLENNWKNEIINHQRLGEADTDYIQVDCFE